MNKDFPGNRWLTAFVSFVILFNASACSASSQNTTHASTATASAIATKVPATQTPTPEPTATPTETPTPKVTPTETFAPMELSTDPEHPAKCTYEDVTSGRLAWNVEQNLKPFPDSAKNVGWKNESSGITSALSLAPGSRDILQLGNICEINDSFLGFTDNRTSYVSSVGVKNIDGTIGVFNVFSPNRDYLNGFFKLFSNTNGNGIAIMRGLNESQTKERWNSSNGQMYRLYKTEGEDKVKIAINKLQITGIVPDEMKKMLFITSKAS